MVAILWLGALLLPVAGWQLWKYSRRRRARAEGTALESAAHERGWRYTDEDETVLAQFKGAPVRADLRRGRHYLSGTHRGLEFVAFDLELVVVRESRGLSIHFPSDWVVVAVRLPRSSPSFHVLPENAVSRSVYGMFGVDIELESERFNRAFSVVGRERRFVVHVLTPETMDVLLEAPTQSWNCHDGWLAMVGRGRLLPQLDGLAVELDRVARVVESIPAFAWERGPGEPRH